MRWLVTALKYIARNPWVWMLGEKATRYIIKPIIDEIKKRRKGKGNADRDNVGGNDSENVL